MSSARSKNNRPCGCGETNYSFTMSERKENLQIHCCRKCSHRWLKEIKVDRGARKQFRSDEDDE